MHGFRCFRDQLDNFGTIENIDFVLLGKFKCVVSVLTCHEIEPFFNSVCGHGSIEFSDMFYADFHCCPRFALCNCRWVLKIAVFVRENVYPLILSYWCSECLKFCSSH